MGDVDEAPEKDLEEPKGELSPTEEFALTGDPMEAQFLANEVARLGAEVAVLRSQRNYWKGVAQMQKSVLTVLTAAAQPQQDEAPPVEPPAKRVTKRPAAKRSARR